MYKQDTHETLKFAAGVLIAVGVSLLGFGAFTYALSDDGIFDNAASTAPDRTAGSQRWDQPSIPIVSGLLCLGVGISLLFVRPSTGAYSGYRGASVPRV